MAKHKPDYSEQKPSKDLKTIYEVLKPLKEIIITNIVLIGQIPPITVPETEDTVERMETNLRAKVFLQRLAEIGIDECTYDSEGNPIGIIKGSGGGKPPILIAAHMDTAFPFDEEVNYTIGENIIRGPGVIDNSLSVGILLSLPEIFHKLQIQFDSDVMLVGFPETLGRNNLKSVRGFLDNWKRPLRGALILEGGEIGRLNYYSDSMIKLEIACHIPATSAWETRYEKNAILIINDVINRILEIHLPQRPKTEIIFGTISGGLKYGDHALDAALGLQIVSGNNDSVNAIYDQIQDIVDSISYENQIILRLDRISHAKAAKLGYSHPLVKSAISVMEELGIRPRIGSDESELSSFLSRSIPALTIGITHGENYHTEEAEVEIEPMFKGIAQVLGLMQAIDKGVCDD